MSKAVLEEPLGCHPKAARHSKVTIHHAEYYMEGWMASGL